MEKISRKDLLETIENQNEKLRRYESRISDVVRAYKGLLKEKEALEASLKALTSAKPPKHESNFLEGTDVSSSNTDEQVSSEAHVVDPLRYPTVENEEKTKDLQNQTETLFAALSTLTEEKSRMETAFQADKKRLLLEKEEFSKDLLKEKELRTKENKEWTKKLQELKLRIREQQQEREKEQQNHALMLRELQCLLAEERTTKEKLEHELDEAKEQIKKTQIPYKKTEEYEKCIHSLKSELKAVLVKESEIKVCQPSPLLLELQQEMADMKVHHQLTVEQEQQRANEAEKKLKSLAAVSEERIANLESRLSELSQMVGNYDRLRQQDQMSIHKLKERITQLDLENTTLARSVAEDKEKPWEDTDLSNADVQTLIERINKLKSLLKVANERSERSINIEEFLRQEEEDSEMHSRCREELQQLKEEFERYKLRAQSVLKSKNSVDSELYSEEIQSLKSQAEDLKDKLHTAKQQIESNEEYHKRVKEKLQTSIQDMKAKYKQELLNRESEYNVKLLELDQQMQKQRERTLQLLEEKEKEIQILRSSIKPSSLLFDMDSIASNISSAPSASNLDNKKGINLPASSTLELDNLTDMLSHTLHTSKGEGRLLYYAQELARKDVEIANVSRARHQAESALRELQQVALAKEEKYTEEIDNLQSKISRLESSQSNKGINMEYLKNVVLRYIMCHDPNGRQHMLNAIATVLHFTSRELHQIRMFNQSWWWSDASSRPS